MRRSVFRPGLSDNPRFAALLACVLVLTITISGCKPREQLAREEAQKERAATEPDVERFGSSDFESNKLLPKSEQKPKWNMPAGLGLEGLKEG
ncbi:MAG: hypothetical protein KDD66_07715, partial [Bdellovibrionales bacterium]|nr:hypothetical protein [Bdellovibrionales bacterium]